jgi:hypothetical protein
VETPSGRALKIIRVLHAFENDQPVTYLELGRDISSSTPTEGGAIAE